MIHGHIVGVTDGDTVTLLDKEKQEHKIRIAGIDAPEKSQAFWQAAKKQMSIMAFEREAIADCPKRDNRERQICVVKVDGLDVGLEQVRGYPICSKPVFVLTRSRFSLVLVAAVPTSFAQ